MEELEGEKKHSWNTMALMGKKKNGPMYYCKIMDETDPSTVSRSPAH